MVQLIPQNFFSFSDFLTTLSLLLLAWGRTDARYQFGMRIIPSPFHFISSRVASFRVITFVGFFILFLEIDQALSGNSLFINHYCGEIIRGFLAFILLATLIVWVYFVFIKPPIFSEKNSFSFLSAIKTAISRSSHSELMAVAEETEKSIGQIINYANRARDKIRSTTTRC